jgi:hypothetical protein
MDGDGLRGAWPFACRPRFRGGRPPSGASSRARSGDRGGLTARGTFDCEAMGARADTTLTRTARARSAPERVGGGALAGALPPLDEPFDLRIDQSAGRVLVRDAGETFGYELRFREKRGKDGGVGWSELSFDPDGGLVEISVRTAEVMALAREAEVADQVAAVTESVAAWFAQTDDYFTRRLARRLRAEVEAGRARERIALRRVRPLIVEQLVEGEPLVVMCERGGFTYRDGRPDTSWLLRRAGLRAERCSKTGKVRTARTASYDVFCQLVAAVDGSPHEFGV